MTAPAHLDDLHFGAAVYCADGTHVGALRRLIVDEESLDPHAIVVKETRHFSGQHLAGSALIEDDVAIPLGALQSVTRERIDLSMTASQVRQTQPYLTYQYAPLARGDVGRMAVAQIGQTAFVRPLIEEAHKRLDELEITPGENIMLGHAGRKLGVVRDLVISEGELVGVVMHPVGIFKEDVLLQVRFLGRLDDLALFVHLTEDDLRQLRPFHPE
ncbi:MAG TPA: hypothetical protein VFR68_09025 [Candidatus Dormibacteraeota bacterium]|nr:hypothetical protein [Candidatus Dormibacteraeota bacterium]